MTAPAANERSGSSRPGLDVLLGARRGIPGWFVDDDVVAFACLHDAQRDAGTRGDVLEIGAYLGRSSVVLGHLLGEDERLVVNDTFEGPGSTRANAEENAFYEGLTLRSFERRFRREHGWLPEIEVCWSSELTSRLAGRRFRMVHVDGSHLHEIVRGDVRVAARLVDAAGVVAFDDIRSAHTPGVAAAVWEAVAADTFRPVLLTERKLYAVRPGAHPDLLARLRRRLDAVPGLELATHHLYDYSVLRVLGGGPSRPVREVLSRSLPDPVRTRLGAVAGRARDAAARRVGRRPSVSRPER